MKPLISLDGSILEPDGATISAVSSAALYGRGVFTTVAIRGGEPFVWGKHSERLDRDSTRVGLEAGGELIAKAETALREVIAASGIAEGKARVTFFECSAPGLWPGVRGGGVSLLVQIATATPPVSPKLTTSPFPVNERSPLCGVKSCNYLEAMLALEEARERGFDEAIRVNRQGQVASGCLANLFWKSRATGHLRTPAISAGCLRGTTRALLIEKMDVEEVAMDYREFISDAVSIYLTSAVRGAAPVSSIDAPVSLVLPDSRVIAIAKGES